MRRLESFSSTLAEKLRCASPEKQRSASLAACELAILKSEIQELLVDEALRQLQSGRPVSPAAQAAIDELAARLDDEYLTLQENDVESGSTESYLPTFSKARAVACLACAARTDPSESIYEAAMALREEDIPELFSVVESALR